MSKGLVLLLLLCLCLGCVIPVHGAEAVYIDTEEELAELAIRVNSGDSMAETEVFLNKDITLTAPFTPIGDADNPFCGSFNGGGYTIRGLRVEDGKDFSGLFGNVVGGSVRDLVLENAVVKGGDYSALLIGRLYCYKGYSAVTNCRAEGVVEGECYTGGILGFVFSAAHGYYAECLVENCGFTGTVKGFLYVGGICGKAEAISTSSRAESIIKSCNARGSVRAVGSYGSMAGGICGAIGAKSNGGSSIAEAELCLSYAEVGAENAAAGGISGVVGGEGYGSRAAVKNSVAFGTVYGQAIAGGIAGQCEKADLGVSGIENSVSGATVIGEDIYPIAKGDGVEDCTVAEDNTEYPADAKVPVYARGDVNGDGRINNLDAGLVLKYDAGLAFFALSKTAADTNGDGKANNLDAAAILKYDAGITEL